MKAKYVLASTNPLGSSSPVDDWHWFDPWDLDRPGFMAIQQWCQEHFGPPGARWRSTPLGVLKGDDERWGRVSFRQSHDAVQFRLRWC